MHLRTQRLIDNYVGGFAIAVLRPATMLLGFLLRRNHELRIHNEVVWVKMLGGGSLVLALPMLLGFRRANPGVRMVLITSPAVRPFAELLGVFDEYRIIDPSGLATLLTTAVETWFKTLRADCIVDLEVHSRLTTVFTTLTMARNRIAFWLDDIFWRRGLASHLVFFNRGSGSFYFYDRIADLFGVPVASREDCRAAVLASLKSPPPARRRGEVAVGFACSDLGQERMLTAAQWVDVVRANLCSSHTAFEFLGGPRDKAQADEIIAAVGAAFPELTLRNACGTMKLGESVLRLFGASEFWGIDSGLLHFARIGGLRCVSYWGPTDPATRLRPTWGLDEQIHYRKIACSPCVHTSETPPCRGDNRCIKGLFVGEAESPANWSPMEFPPRRGRMANV
jgi:ADP-heptose:LPS heptosyltransferase